jgi:tetratricopeptide (TPR) repeat protein
MNTFLFFLPAPGSWILASLFLLTPLLYSAEPSHQKLQTLYNSLDPQSVSQHLAFYQLYGDTKQGKMAINHAWSLFSHSTQAAPLASDDLSSLPVLIPAIVAMVNKQPHEAVPILSEEEIAGINRLAAHLPNRQLRGYNVLSERELLQLPADQVDLARGLFLSQMGEDSLQKIQSYEALLDLMALQILARVSLDATPQRKIRVINDFIFDEMGFRFPPRSIYANDIDIYTFLPSVLDSQRGVCLGVSILYISLAQRLNLPLEMITPPGHIYIRYRSGDEIINIETTARGVDMDSKAYLGINTRSLQMRDLKEVIACAYMNEAAVYWQKDDYEKGIAIYLKAQKYLPKDELLTEFLGYVTLFAGHESEGRRLLNLIKDRLPTEAIVKSTIAEDYLNGAADAEGIKAIFHHVDETRESVLDKQKLLQAAVQRCPRFRAAWFHLAVTWLQLHRTSEALKVLEKYATMESCDPEADYYLASLYASRLDYNQAWKHLRHGESIVHANDHDPEILKEMRRQLTLLSPE